MNRLHPFPTPVRAALVAFLLAYCGALPTSAQLTLDSPDVLIHTDPDARDEPPVVSADPSGRPFVCWPRWFGLEIECGLLDADLSPAGPLRPVDGETDRDIASRLSLASNGSTFAVAWEGFSHFGVGLFGRPLDLEGEPLDFARPVADGVEGFRSHVDLAALADGSYFGVWMGAIAVDDVIGAPVILGRRFDGSMQPLGPERVLQEPTFSSRNARIVPAPGGGFLLLWASDAEGVFARPFDGNGAPTGAKVKIDQTKMAAAVETLTGSLSAAGADGRYLVAWDVDHYIKGTMIRGRILDASGRPVGDEIAISGPRSTYGDLPAVAADGAGGFVIAWRGYSQGAPNNQLFARRLDGAGVPQSGEMELSEDPTAHHSHPDIARLGPGRLVVVWMEGVPENGEYRVRARTLTAAPIAPAAGWLSSPTVPGFEFHITLSTPAGSILGALEPECIPETVCVSGAIPGRSEVFARVVGPKPNGFLWPTLIKFSTSQVEVWVRQEATDEVRYYVLEGARPGFDELPGLFDRTGFEPMGVSLQSSLFASDSVVLAAGDSAPPPPDGTVFTSEHFPDFRFRVRITSDGQAQEVRQEGDCIEETVCLSGAIPGRSEIFLRVVGPKPNGRLWPTIVKFTTSKVEVWVEQISTATTKYYAIEGAAPGNDNLTGLFDRVGFEP